MPVKKVEPKPMNGAATLGRRVALAYLGLLAIVGEESVKLFDLFVQRGEKVEKDLRKRAERGEKDVRKLAVRFRREEHAAANHVHKTAKRTAKKVEAVA
jgi:transcription initiation factor IIE alpha subunit